jgi:hypothetical protein
MKLLLVAQVATDAELTKGWHAVSAAHNKLARITVQSYASSTASEFGIPNLAPLITPTLCTNIVNFQCDMAILDDLEAGFQPLTVGSCGTTTSRSTRNAAN